MCMYMHVILIGEQIVSIFRLFSWLHVETIKINIGHDNLLFYCIDENFIKYSCNACR